MMGPIDVACILDLDKSLEPAPFWPSDDSRPFKAHRFCLIYFFDVNKNKTAVSPLHLYSGKKIKNFVFVFSPSSIHQENVMKVNKLKGCCNHKRIVVQSSLCNQDEEEVTDLISGSLTQTRDSIGFPLVSFSFFFCLIIKEMKS